MIIKEVLAKSIMTKTGIPDSDYVINPYVGCSHGCKYCYADFIVRKFKKISHPWGEFVQVKINAPEILKKEIKHKKKGIVLFSSICDPYQPVEAKYKLTRQCLEILLEHQFPVSILTKSKFALRDIDLFKEFEDSKVGLSITTDDDEIRKIFEPRSPSIEERIKALDELHRQGIYTYVFIGPILPQNPERLASLLKDKVDCVLIDKMNYSYKVKKIYRTCGFEYALEPEYFEDVAKKLEKIFRKSGVKVTVCFP